MKDWKSIDAFFSPKSVAVIGASEQKGSVGSAIFGNVAKIYGTKAFPVNPKHAKIQGKKTYASVKDIPFPVDLAVIAVPSQFVPSALEECMEKKCGAAIIVSAGFSEVGEKKLTAQISELIKKHPHTRVMGPNCVGVMNNHSGLDTTFFSSERMQKPKKGNLSFISQSGALGSMILDWVATQDFGISKFASYGNAMDVDEADLLEYFGRDKKTKVITMYLEGARDGRKFYETAKKVSRQKPIIVLKGGRSEETSKATASHTGSLAGSSKVYDAVFKQAGIIQVNDLIELFNVAKLLEKEPLPKGNRVQIITNGGGFGIVTADQVIANGLRLAKLSQKTVSELGHKMPMATISNPMDLIGDADVARFKEALKATISDKNADIIMVLVLFNLPAIEAQKLSILKGARKKLAKPIIVISIGSDYTEKYMGKIEKAGFTTFTYPSIAARSMKEMASYAEFLRKA